MNDIFNRTQNKQISSFSRPLVLGINVNYTLPSVGGNKALSWAVRDWQLATVLAYASGRPIRAPLAQSSLNQYLFRGNDAGTRGPANGTNAVRVEGQPLFTQDLNCHCYDPNREFVLNPAAWTDPAPGQFGNSAPYFNDYREQRRPQESLAIGRLFHLTEGGVRLQIRVEWSNIFNRSYTNNPDSTNARAAQTRDASLNTVSGFGRINTATTFSNFLPRQGTIVARLTF